MSDIPNPAWILTVDWCSQGKRGVFCTQDGGLYWSETEHTRDEMGEILGIFDMVLDPKSVLMTREELNKHVRWHPLGEYSDVYGYAVTEEVDNGNVQ